MGLSRRDFLKASGVGVGGALLLGAFNSEAAQAASPSVPLKKQNGEKTTICPYCACGCGLIVATQDGKVVNVEGDTQHPINRGAACAKGQSIRQLGAGNPRRLSQVLYRQPGGSQWEEKTWDWAIGEIAQRIKKTRDSAFITTDSRGNKVNRCESIASLGGAALNNEECYTLSKMARALGIVYLENSARLSHSTSVTGLAESFGRGVMTNHLNDIGNSDCILIIGANPAENHPAAFAWIMTARDKGAKLIVVDPRFTRSAARADLYAPIRSGTDIAFINGMIKYILDDMEKNPASYNMAYVVEYTNASYLLNPDYKGPAELDGLFSGYGGGLNEADTNKRQYSHASWQFQADDKGMPMRDKTLQDPSSVFQVLKRQVHRYTPEMVSKVCGTSKDTFMEICRAFAATGQAGKAGSILYATGATQHTSGTQNIRAYAILQLLLANIGVAGGGLNAMPGESNAQGSTDMGLLYNMLPGYLKPFQSTDPTLARYIERATPVPNDPLSQNWWKNTPRYIISLLKAWYGSAATSENQFAFDLLPKIETGKNYSHIALFETMSAGNIKGLMVWGQNPAVGGPNANLERQALDKLEWMVVSDLFETETAAFWKRPGVSPASIRTEVFLLPAKSSFEKEGSVTNSGRWLQWRYQCADAPGQAQQDHWMMTRIMLKLKELYAKEAGPNAEAITGLTWNYGDPPDARLIAREISGYDLGTGKLLNGFTDLKDDGSTASGCWVYCGSCVEPDVEPNAPVPGNRASRRDLTGDHFNTGRYPNWAWSWPMNERIMYNRASVDLNGDPWDKGRPVISWRDGKWLGDVADGAAKPVAQGGTYPFVMVADGLSRIFAPGGLTDGPLPEHYEPWESPVRNAVSRQTNNPVMKVWRPDEQGTPEWFPVVGMTCRVGEQCRSGAMTRNSPWLNEMMPEPFVEMSEELAVQKGIKNGDRVIVESTRGAVSMTAAVTRRVQALQIGGSKIEQVGLVWHWGYAGQSVGDSANVLTPHAGDANSWVPEYKSFLVNIRKA